MKALKGISIACMFLGIILCFGAVGGGDLNTISFRTLVVLTLISSVMIIGGYLGAVAVDSVTISRKKFKHMRKKG